MKRLLLTVLAVGCFAALSFAQDTNLPGSARAAGVSNASLTFQDVWSVFNNQAGLAGVETISAGAFYESRFTLKELSVRGAALALPVGGGTFGLSYNSYGYSLYNQSKYGLAYARKLGEDFYAGVQIDYLNLRLGENYGSQGGFTVQAGFQYQMNDELMLSAHVYNPNRTQLSDYNDERTPSILKAGIQYRFSEKIVTVAEFSKDLDYDVRFKAGLEYQLVDDFFVRAGVGTAPASTSLGFGYAFKGFKLDIASAYRAVIGFTPQISLTYAAE